MQDDDWYRCDGIERNGTVDVLGCSPMGAAREYAIDACDHGLADGDVTVVVTGKVPKNFEPFAAPQVFRFSVRRVVKIECTEGGTP